MRKHATLLCATLALTTAGCAGGQAQPAVNAAVLAPAVAPSAAPAARTTSGSRASGGTATFGDYVRARQPQLQFCYEETRAKHPKLAGSATVAVSLAADGSVQAVDIVRKSWSGKGFKEVESCVLSKVRGWRFPASESPDEVRAQSFVVVFNR